MDLHRPLPPHLVQPVHGVPVDLVPGGGPEARDGLPVQEAALLDGVVHALLEEDPGGDLEAGHPEAVQQRGEDGLPLLLRLRLGEEPLVEQQLSEVAAALGYAAPDPVVAGLLGPGAQVGVDGVAQLVGLGADVTHGAREALEHVGGLARQPGGAEGARPLPLPHLAVYVPPLEHLLHPVAELFVELGVGGDHLLPGLLPGVLHLGGVGEGGDDVPVGQLLQAHHPGLHPEVPLVEARALHDGAHEAVDGLLVDVVGDEALGHRGRVTPDVADLQVVGADRPDGAGPEDLVPAQVLVDDLVRPHPEVPVWALVEADDLPVGHRLHLPLHLYLVGAGGEPVALELLPGVDAVLVLGEDQPLLGVREHVGHVPQHPLQVVPVLGEGGVLDEGGPAGQELAHLDVDEGEGLVPLHDGRAGGVVELLGGVVEGVGRVEQPAVEGDSPVPEGHRVVELQELQQASGVQPADLAVVPLPDLLGLGHHRIQGPPDGGGVSALHQL